MIQTNNAVKPQQKPIKAIEANLLFMSMRSGEVACALQQINQEVSVWKEFDGETAPFKVGQITSSIPNCVAALSNILKQLCEEEDNFPGKFIIALPKSVYNLVSNIEILTKMIWHGVIYLGFLDKKYQDKNLPEDIRTWKIRPMTNGERKVYTSLLMNLSKTMGKVCIVNSKFTLSSGEWQDAKSSAIQALYGSNMPEDAPIED